MAKKSTASASKTHARRPSSPGVTFIGIEAPKTMTATRPNPNQTNAVPKPAQIHRPNIAHGRKPPSVQGIINLPITGTFKTSTNVVQNQRAQTAHRNQPRIVGNVILNRVNLSNSETTRNQNQSASIDLTSPDPPNTSTNTGNPQRAYIVHGRKPPSIVGGPIPNTASLSKATTNTGQTLRRIPTDDVQSIDLTDSNTYIAPAIVNTSQNRRPRIFVGRKPPSVQQITQNRRSSANESRASMHGQGVSVDHGLRTKASRARTLGTYDKRKASSGHHSVSHYGIQHGPQTLRRSDMGGARSYMRQPSKKKPSSNSSHGRNPNRGAPHPNRGAAPSLTRSNPHHRVMKMPERGKPGNFPKAVHGTNGQTSRKTTASVAHPPLARKSQDGVIVLSDSD